MIPSEKRKVLQVYIYMWLKVDSNEIKYNELLKITIKKIM